MKGKLVVVLIDDLKKNFKTQQGWIDKAIEQGKTSNAVSYRDKLEESISKNRGKFSKKKFCDNENLALLESHGAGLEYLSELGTYLEKVNQSIGGGSSTPEPSKKEKVVKEPKEPKEPKAATTKVVKVNQIRNF